MKEDTVPEEDRTIVNRLYPTANQPPIIKQKLQEKCNFRSLSDASSCTVVRETPPPRTAPPARVLLAGPPTEHCPGFRESPLGQGPSLSSDLERAEGVWPGSQGSHSGLVQSPSPSSCPCS